MEYYYLDNNVDISFEVQNERPQLSVVQLAEADRLWDMKSKQSNLWHNGLCFTCLGLEHSSNKIKIKLGQTDYKTYTYLRENNIHISCGYISGLIILIRSRGDYLFFERSSKVGTDLRKLAAIGGSLPYSSYCDAEYVYNHAVNELKEELILEDTSVTPHLISLAYDPANGYLNFCFHVDLNNVELRGDENMNKVAFSAAELKTQIDSGLENFDKSTQIHLPKVIVDINS